ncbi:sulfite reductase [Defluviimonas sp. 20V17]|uniref:Sulfite reductase n=1 Tax=Allgaiera indica TaxID=765699 RepID=A0AAN5A120_9RHOB|nr:nitrite/sulfite reductase [Allgaiera indica]KDB04950.1 sulfite reductase [Defluviimonas sp. 20V17]GHE05726.1 sulfite reductase [Allgaiera indica]SDX76743.1 sulfite reductase (NADPH) hemoprotein beta-component [Allgaiera indica]
MYRPTEADAAFLRRRADEFRQQVARRLDGSLTEEEFRPLRLMNGLYLQLHAYMLRVAIPYGTLNGTQLRQLAMIAERWDKGYGHMTTRQNIQFNWPRLSDVPDILDALAEVGMHAVQTSGNTIRNVTADPYAGAAADEVADPRPLAELVRQWSTDHPAFQFLPRKFKFAVTGSPADRAILRAHDVGLQLVRRGGALGVRVLVGGGLGRTPLLGEELRAFVTIEDLLPYLEAVLETYNLVGRRDNKYKARIKVTLREEGIAALSSRIEARFADLRGLYPGATREYARIARDFARPALTQAPTIAHFTALADPAYAAWAATNLVDHHDPDHAIVRISLKGPGATPGDITAAQMRRVADLAQAHGNDEIRVGQDQNLILPHVHRGALPAVHAALAQMGLATANAGLATDITACPGMDYCTLATARSIPVAQALADRLRPIERDLGPVSIKISGCINACGHHHLGHIGILGLDRAGVETYQITLGGDAGADTALGERTGPGFAYDQIVPAIDRILRAYLRLRRDASERFIDTIRRLGPEPFKTALYQETRHAA